MGLFIFLFPGYVIYWPHWHSFLKNLDFGFMGSKAVDILSWEAANSVQRL